MPNNKQSHKSQRGLESFSFFFFHLFLSPELLMTDAELVYALESETDTTLLNEIGPRLLCVQ